MGWGNSGNRGGYYDAWHVWHEASPPDMGNATVHVPVPPRTAAPDAPQPRTAPSAATQGPERPSLRLLPPPDPDDLAEEVPPDVVATALATEPASMMTRQPDRIRGMRALLSAMLADLKGDGLARDDAIEQVLHERSRERIAAQAKEEE